MVFTQRPGRGNNGNGNGPVDNEPYISPSRAMTGPIHAQGQGQQPYMGGYGSQGSYQQNPYAPNYQGQGNPQNNPYQQPYFDNQQQKPPQRKQQRQEELKGLSFWQDEEDMPYPEDGDDTVEKSSPFKFIVAVTGLVIVSGILWLGYRWATKAESLSIPLVQAEQGFYKARPDQPGGMSFPHQDMLVYGRLTPNQQNQQVDRIVPQDPYAEQQQYQQVPSQQQQMQQQMQPQQVPMPVQQQVSQPQQPVIQQQVQQPVVQQQPVLSPQEQMQQQMIVHPQNNVQLQPQPTGIVASKQPDQVLQQQQVAPVPQQVQSVASQPTKQLQPADKVQTQQVVDQSLLKTDQQKLDAQKDLLKLDPKAKIDLKNKATAEVKTAIDSGFYMQLASLPNAESAKKEWIRIRDDKKFAIELSNQQSVIKQSDVGIKKVYSILVGPFPDRDIPLKKCINLVKGCRVIEIKPQ